MKRIKFIALLLLAAITFANCKFSGRPSLAIVSPHLELDPYAFQQAAKGLGSKMKTDVYGLSGSGDLPLFSVNELSKHDLVIFESLGTRITLLKPQIDSIKSKTKVLFLNTPLAKGNIEESKYPEISKYWLNGNAENYKGLLSYLASKVFKLDVAVQTPIIYPANGFYHPQSKTLFKSSVQYFNWYNKHLGNTSDSSKPAIGIVFYQTNYIRKDLAHIDALIKSIEAHGAKAVPLMQKSGFKLDSFFMDHGKPVVDVVLYGGMYLNFAHPEKGRASAARLDVPLLGSATHYLKNPRQWEKDKGGFSPEMTDRFYFTERDGVFEPMIVGAEEKKENGDRKIVAIQHQIDWRVERAIAWANLRRKRNAEKKIILTYYSEGSGKANVGGDIDAYLDVQQSLVHILNRLKKEGYNVGNKPLPSAGELTKQMALHASNVGSWAPQELKKRMSNGDFIRITDDQYQKWLASYPIGKQREIKKAWGNGLGNMMTITEGNHHRSFIIPVIKFGNITLAPHPNWGLQDNEKLIYGKNEIPPSHAYLAFYEWMKRVEKPDAFVSLFTQLSLMPGKLEGPSSEDWNGKLIGNIPHVSLVPLIANGGVGNKRRASALTIGYMTEITRAGLTDSLKQLDNTLSDWNVATNPVLKNKIKNKAVALIEKLGLKTDMGMDRKTDAHSDGFLNRCILYINKLSKARMASGGHIFGVGPTGQTQKEMLEEMMGTDFTKTLPGKAKDREMLAKQIIEQVANGANMDKVVAKYFRKPDTNIFNQLQLIKLYQHNLLSAGQESDQLIKALNGRYISTGPGDDPIRNPESLPSGKNPYSINTKSIPTKEAWSVGKRMADQLLIQFEKKHGKGKIPKKVAFVLWSAEVTNNQGVNEAEIMYLMGITPVWNDKGNVMDVALIKPEELGRPRIDVLITTSGTYRDHFSGNMKMLDRAVKLAAKQKENTNEVRNNTLAYQKKLGLDSMEKATYRVFSSNQGAYSTNLEFAAETGESWKSDTTLSNLYLKRMSHAYGENVDASFQSALFELNIRDVDAAAFSRSSSVYGVLDHPMVAAYFGAYNLAVKNTSGKQPDLFINDLQDTSGAEVTPINEFFHTELRSRYLNPKWMKSMMKHGYDGARYMQSFTENMMLWDVTTPDLVTDNDWNELYDTYVNDKHQVGVKAYMEEKNPYAAQAMLSTMLEASEKGYWKASEKQLQTLAKSVAGSVVKNGAACNTVVCNSPRLAGFIGKIVNRVPGGKSLSEGYAKTLAQLKSSSVGAKSGTGKIQNQVSGQQIVEEKTEVKPANERTGKPVIMLLILACAILFVAGWFRGSKN
ncbi:cobaltochelatase subunit CobN [Pedobacter sp. MR22-3]|uniref:cobaltochelatase subunit CobN n=1 Tax=Pedobacter sp. MR22-3 TaxID=2994552 RepID=UPI0022484734|nr:cobaltochelatase subunit CobN [Pedobacter sp. MR22-3]MCX2584361.1 cobaltochelatase subunit CobN [Pedobacter sp. MR22-3]